MVEGSGGGSNGAQECLACLSQIGTGGEANGWEKASEEAQVPPCVDAAYVG